MSKYQMILYGSNTDCKTSTNRVEKYPLKSIVLAKPDLVTFSFTSQDLTTLKGLFADLQVENETKTYWSGGNLTINTAKDKWKPETIPIKLLDNRTPVQGESYNTNEIFGKDFLNKKYKWLDILDYEMRPETLENDYTKVIAVNIVGATKGVEEGYTTFSFEIVERP